MNVMVIEPDRDRLADICSVVESLPNWQVVAKGGSPHRAVEGMAGLDQVELLVMNIDTSSAWDLRAWGLLQSMVNPDHILALTSRETSEIVEFALGMKFRGLQPLTCSAENLRKALESINRGETAYEPGLLDNYRKAVTNGDPTKEGISVSQLMSNIRSSSGHGFRK